MVLKVPRCCSTLAGGGVALDAEIVHGGDELGHARHHRVLDRAHVLVRAAEHFLQQDVGLAQALEQGGGVGAQHAVGFQHVGDGRRGGLLRFLDRGYGWRLQILERARDRLLGRIGDALRALLQLAERAGHRGGGVLARFVDQPGDLLAVVHHRLGEDEALGLDRLHRLVGDAADLAGEFLALAGQRGDQPVRLFVEQPRHFADPLRHVVGDLLGVADDIAGDFVARADQRALGLAGAAADQVGRAEIPVAVGHGVGQRAGAAAERSGRFGSAAIERFGRRRARRRALAERFGGAGGELAERLLGVAGIGLDRFRQLFEPRAEQVGGGAAALSIVGDRFGAADSSCSSWPMRLSSVRHSDAGRRVLVDLGDALRRSRPA